MREVKRRSVNFVFLGIRLIQSQDGSCDHHSGIVILSLPPALTSSFLLPPAVCPAQTRLLRGKPLSFLLRTPLLLGSLLANRVFSTPPPLCRKFPYAARCALRIPAGNGALCRR